MTHLHLPARPLAAATALLALGASLLAGGPARAATPAPTPGSLTGYAFDLCDTPDQAGMDAWRKASPYWGAGVYLGGENLLAGCDTSNLTAAWVSRQLARGWRLLPIWVGAQASCTSYAHRIDDQPASGYAAARAQGRVAADQAGAAARALGVPAGSTLWYDIENFDLQASDDCRRSALSFLSAWTKQLHKAGFASGVYSNVAAAVHALDYADTVSPKAYAEPDQVWYAWYNGRADTEIATKWVRAGSWTPHRRVHQYARHVQRTYGGVTMTVDENYLDLGRGSVAPKPAASCGVRVSFPSYHRIARGDTGAQVKAAQCLLRKRHYYDGNVTGRFDRATVLATRRLQRASGLTRSGVMDRRAWTALLSSGRGPLLKVGSAEEAVRRLQRALNAARNDRVAVSGVFRASTTRSLKRYQRDQGLPRTGVATAEVWAALRQGRR